MPSQTAPEVPKVTSAVGAAGGRGNPDSSSAAESPSEELYRPLGSYVGLTALFLTVFGSALGLAAAQRRLPERFSATDLVLLGTAGHKVSRLVAKDEVTAFIREPFVVVREDGEGDPEEAPRGRGPRRALGELLSCPSCVGQWAAAGLCTSLIWAPRTTRFVASIFVVDTVSDFLHVAYRGLKERA